MSRLGEIQVLLDHLSNETNLLHQAKLRRKIQKMFKEQAEQNKKYRKMIKDMSNEIEILTDVMSNADNADELNEEVIWLKGVRGYCIHCNGKGFNGLDYCPQCNQLESDSE